MGADGEKKPEDGEEKPKAEEKPPVIDGKRLLNYVETAWYCGMPVKTLRNACSRGAARPFPVRPHRWGKKVVFDRQELDRYIDSLSRDPS